MSRESQQQATIKKLIEQRDEARVTLANEHNHPLIKQLQELCTDLKVQLSSRSLGAEAQATQLNEHAAQVERLTKRVAQMTLDRERVEKEYAALVNNTEQNYEAIIIHLKTELRALNNEDAKTLRKRLAAKSEDLRVMTAARDELKVIFVRLSDELIKTKAQLGLLPPALQPAQVDAVAK